jgi:Spy/CpxP family protein refolding chaperone
MYKKIFTAILMAIALTAFINPTSYAGSKEQKHYDLESNFYNQTHKILEHNKELALSDDQIKEIKSIKKQVKKDLVKQDADINALEVEINTLMWEAPLSLAETNALVDEKHELTKKKEKYLITYYDKLNKVLTEEQLKELNKTF